MSMHLRGSLQKAEGAHRCMTAPVNCLDRCWLFEMLLRHDCQIAMCLDAEIAGRSKDHHSDGDHHPHPTGGAWCLVLAKAQTGRCAAIIIDCTTLFKGKQRP